MSPIQAELVALLIVFVAMFARSVVGFGDGIISLPLLSLLLGLSNAVPLVALLALTSAFTIALTSWRSINWRAIRPYL